MILEYKVEERASLWAENLLERNHVSLWAMSITCRVRAWLFSVNISSRGVSGFCKKKQRHISIGVIMMKLSESSFLSFDGFLTPVSLETSESAFSQMVEERAKEMFNNVTVFNHEVTVYVPSKDKDGQPIDFNVLAKEIQKRLKELFGGFTAIEGCGTSQESSPSESEDVMSVSSSTTIELLRTHLREVFKLAKWILEEFRQDSVAVAINRKLLVLKNKPPQDQTL